MIVLINLGITIAAVVSSLFLYPIDPDRKTAHRICEGWGRGVLFVSPGWRLKIQGRGYIRDGKSYVLVANHSSLSDIIYLYHLGKQFKWMAKESLFWIPFFGWAMSAAGYIRLARGKQGSIRDSLDKSVEWLRRNISILIFPEGTRSRSGGLGAFKNGAFKLAIRTQKPIVPIVLTGTRGTIQKGSLFFSYRINCKLKVLKPIPTDGYLENQYLELGNLVRSQMLEAIELLEGK